MDRKEAVVKTYTASLPIKKDFVDTRIFSELTIPSNSLYVEKHLKKFSFELSKPIFSTYFSALSNFKISLNSVIGLDNGEYEFSSYPNTFNGDNSFYYPETSYSNLYLDDIFTYSVFDEDLDIEISLEITEIPTKSTILFFINNYLSNITSCYVNGIEVDVSYLIDYDYVRDDRVLIYYRFPLYRITQEPQSVLTFKVEKYYKSLNCFENIFNTSFNLVNYKQNQYYNINNYSDLFDVYYTHLYFSTLDGFICLF